MWATVASYHLPATTAAWFDYRFIDFTSTGFWRKTRRETRPAGLDTAV